MELVRWTFLTALLACSSVGRALSQTDTGGGAAANRITLDVAGSALPDGALGEFTLLDNGRPRAIESVRRVDGMTGGVQVVLVIDAVNARYSTVAFERDMIKKFLLADGGKLAYPTSLAVMSDKGMQLGEAPSTDGTGLNAALEKDVIGLREFDRETGIYGAEERLNTSLRCLGLLLGKLGTEPGRKLVIFISPGWPLLSGPELELGAKQREEVFASIVRTSTKMRTARVTLYSINPIGPAENLARAGYYRQFVKGMVDKSRVELGDVGLQVLAAQSGGLVDESTNGVAEAIARDVKDANQSYALTFVSPDGESGVAYHELQVKGPDGRLARTRAGYYVGSPMPQ